MSLGENADYVAVGQRIKALRGAMTQADFAARLGVDRKTVVRWEAGERLPDGGSLLALAREFEADVHDILTGETQHQRAVRALTESQKENLRKVQVARDAGLLPPVADASAKQPDLIGRLPDGQAVVVELKDPAELHLVSQYRRAAKVGKKAILATAEAVAPPPASTSRRPRISNP